MNRFRFTFIAICFVLLILGGTDLHLWWTNPSPAEIPVEQLEKSNPPREWLHVTGGYLDLNDAISTSGSIELDALLVPLRSAKQQERIHILVETRAPRLLNLFKQYHFFTDTIPEKKAFLDKHRETFHGQQDVTGMLVSGLIAKGNRQKLLKLARQTELEITDDVIFLSEGKEPGKWRGVFFVAVGLLGLVRLLFKKRDQQAGEEETT